MQDTKVRVGVVRVCIAYFQNMIPFMADAMSRHVELDIRTLWARNSFITNSRTRTKIVEWRALHGYCQTNQPIR